VTVFPEGGPGHTEAVFYAGGPGHTKTALPYGTYEDLLLSPFDLAHGFPAYNIIQRRRGPRPASRLATQVWAGRDFPKESGKKEYHRGERFVWSSSSSSPFQIVEPLPPDKTGGKLNQNPSGLKGFPWHMKIILP